MAKEEVKPVVAPKEEVHPDGSIDIGTKPGEYNIAHKKNDGTDVVIKVITN